MERIPKQKGTTYHSFEEYFVAKFGREIDGRIQSLHAFMDSTESMHVDISCLRDHGSEVVRCYFDIVDGALALKDTRAQRGSCIPLGLPLDKNLIPILDFAEMEKRAEGILKRFYPKSMKASYTIEGALRAYVFEAGYIPEEEMDVKMLDQQVTHLNNVIHMLPHGFGDTLVWYMKRKNITAEKLAERSNLSEKTIQRCRNIKDERIPFNTAMALCVGLQLPGLLGRDLLHKAGHTLRDTKTDMVYRAVLDYMTRNRIDEVDRFLEGMRLKPLTRTKDE